MRPIEATDPEVIMQPWGTETILARTAAYTLKRLDYRAGREGGLQYHMRKAESFHLHSGVAVVTWDEGEGVLVSRRAVAGDTFTIPAGAPHQFHAVTDCVVFEASEPVMNDRVNVAAYYGRTMPEGTLPTTWTEEEIAAFERDTASHREGLVVSP